jgi:hypothetical protein
MIASAATISTKVKTAVSEVRMDANIEKPAYLRHPRTGRSAKLREIAFALQCSEATAEKKLWGPHAVNLETAKCIQVMLNRGETEEAAAFEAPILAALMGTEVPHWSESIYPHNSHDALEDVAQADFIQNAGDAELAQWIKKLAADLRHGEKLLAGLVNEQQKRRQA